MAELPNPDQACFAQNDRGGCRRLAGAKNSARCQKPGSLTPDLYRLTLGSCQSRATNSVPERAFRLIERAEARCWPQEASRWRGKPEPSVDRAALLQRKLKTSSLAFQHPASRVRGAVFCDPPHASFGYARIGSKAPETP